MKKLLLIVTLAASAAVSYGQGTIQFVNTALQRFQLRQGGPSGSITSNAPPSLPVNIGIFFGGTAATLATTPVMPFGTIGTTPGVMIVPGGNGSVYPLPGTQPGDIVFARVRAWSSSFGSDWQAAFAAWNGGNGSGYYGETDIRALEALGASSGPGTVIWQGSSGTVVTRFNPLLIVQAIPEPSVIALAVIGLGGLLALRRRK